MKRNISLYLRLLAMIYAGTALGILWFWYQFFTGALFSLEELRPLIANFDGYYDWEKSFLLPDSILAAGMLISAARLWMARGRDQGRILAAMCAGAALFLGVLDLNYGFSTGLYEIAHSYGEEVLGSGISITVVGLVAVAILSAGPADAGVKHS